MNETNSSWLSANPCRVTSTGTSNINEYINGYSGTTISGNSTLNTFSSLTVQNMTPKQVKVAVFTIHRDPDTNEINSTKFVKELWVEKKNGTSLDLIVAKHLDKDFDPETTIVKEIYTVSF
jgi:hypothetical protein